MPEETVTEEVMLPEEVVTRGNHPMGDCPRDHPTGDGLMILTTHVFDPCRIYRRSSLDITVRTERSLDGSAY